MKKVNDTKEMTFLEHLEELRWHIIRSLLGIIIFAILSFIFYSIIFDKILFAPRNPWFFTNRLLCEFGEQLGISALCINNKPLELININMAGQFSTHITVSCIAGIIIAFPYVFWEFWRFIEPALNVNEKKYSRGAVFFSSALFLLGILFGYFIISPLSVEFLGTYNVSSDVSNQINLGSYISLVTSVVLASGAIFELPVLMFFLSKTGIVTPDILKKHRRHAFILVLALSAIITPPDIFSQVLVALPLTVLYEVGIAISKKISRESNEVISELN